MNINGTLDRKGLPTEATCDKIIAKGIARTRMW